MNSSHWIGAWFCGFTPNVVTVTWLGFDDMAKLGEGETATNVALPLWIDYMHRVLEGVPSKEWERPLDLKDSDLALPVEGEDTEGGVAPANQGGFQYQNERDLAPAAPPRPNQQGNAPAAPAPRRAPERVEIPEQLF